MSSLIFKLASWFILSRLSKLLLFWPSNSSFWGLARIFSATTTTQTAWQRSSNSSRNSRSYFSEHIYQRHENKIELLFNSDIFLAKLKSFEIHKKIFVPTFLSSLSNFFCFLSEIISRRFRLSSCLLHLQPINFKLNQFQVYQNSSFQTHHERVLQLHKHYQKLKIQQAD